MVWVLYSLKKKFEKKEKNKRCLNFIKYLFINYYIDFDCYYE